jgi:hypothetical protein
MEYLKIQTIISRYFNVVERDTPNGRFKNIFPKDSTDSLYNIRSNFIWKNKFITRFNKLICLFVTNFIFKHIRN